MLEREEDEEAHPESARQAEDEKGERLAGEAPQQPPLPHRRHQRRQDQPALAEALEAEHDGIDVVAVDHPPPDDEDRAPREAGQDSEDERAAFHRRPFYEIGPAM